MVVNDDDVCALTHRPHATTRGSHREIPVTW
jgi:hypothetical protein